MEIPSKIKIGGHLFDIEYKSEDETGYERSGTKFGWLCKIRIQKDMVQSKKEVTLFHEIFHEIDYQHELGLTEKNINTLAECWYQVLKDNDWLK